MPPCLPHPCLLISGLTATKRVHFLSPKQLLHHPTIRDPAGPRLETLLHTHTRTPPLSNPSLNRRGYCCYFDLEGSGSPYTSRSKSAALFYSPCEHRYVEQPLPYPPLPPSLTPPPLRRPQNLRWFLIGPKRSGSSVHVDPLSTSAWNTLLSGRKLWVLSPPGTLRALRGLPPRKGKDGDPKRKEAIRYFIDDLPRIRLVVDSAGTCWLT